MVYQHSQCLPLKSLNQLSPECLWGMRQKTELLTGKYLKHFWKQIYFSQGEINQRRDIIYLPKKNNTGGRRELQMLQSQAWSISGKFVLTEKGKEVMGGDEGRVWGHSQPTDLPKDQCLYPRAASLPSLSPFTTGPPNNFFSRESLQRRSNTKSNVFEARFKSSLKHS